MDPVWLQYLAQMGMPGTQSGYSDRAPSGGHPVADYFSQQASVNRAGQALSNIGALGAAAGSVAAPELAPWLVPFAAVSAVNGANANDRAATDERGRAMWLEYGRRMGWSK